MKPRVGNVKVVSAKVSNELPLTLRQGSWRRAAIWLGVLLLSFGLIQSLLPLKTAIQIGADEGFELAKATLCAHGYKLYTEIWNDQPPLHTFIITEILEHISRSILGPRLVTSGFAIVLLASYFFLIRELSGLATAVIATGLLIASPGFLELSASCMLEIPGLSVAILGLCVLANVGSSRWYIPEILAGIIFGMALQIKLIGLVWTPLFCLLLCIRFLPASKEPLRLHSMIATAMSPRVIVRVIVFGMAFVASWLTVDFIVDGGAYLANFQETLISHFSEAKTTEYGSAAEHAFDWIYLLRNWDALIPAMGGAVLVGNKLRRDFALWFPFAWLLLALTVFATHKPWWSYYYVHLAVPLCWCAAIGIAAAVERAFNCVRSNQASTPRPARWIASLPFVGTIMFLTTAAIWTGARMYLQISTMQSLPRTFAALVLKEIGKYKPYTHYFYTDDISYSFLADIPMPPTLAVMPLKRFWSGQITNEKIAEDFARYKPELVMLRNNEVTIPFQDELNQDYRLVYQDNERHLYVLTTLITRLKNQAQSKVPQ